LNFHLKINDKSIFFFGTFIFAILFSIYETPWGLMDDYKNVILIKEVLENPLQAYLQFTSDRVFISGMFQPFYLPQMFFQYYPGVIFDPIITFSINAFIVFFIHYYLFKSFEKIIKIDYKVSLFIFLIWPYTYDLFLHPSLQEKYIFLFFGFLLREILKSKPSTLKIILISFLLPLMKLQGAIFIGYIFLLYLYTKQRYLLISTISFSLAIAIQGYIIFFLDTDYFVYDSNVEKMFNNIGNIANLIFLSIILSTVLISLKDLNSKSVHLLGLSFSAILLVIIYSNWNIYGYLLASYSFLISIFLSYLAAKTFSQLSSRKLKSIFISILLIISLISAFLFLIPRLERWQQITNVNNELEQKLDQSVYYCAQEGTKWLNQIKGNKNNIQYVNNYKEINEKVFYFINDSFQCDYFTKELSENCIGDNYINTTSQKFYLIKYTCLK